MIGKTISHYKIVEKLGEGGMGVVYKAEDTNLKRYVALKFLPPELTRDKKARERFIHEAQSASALDHPNVCTVYEIGKTEDGQMFIAMGYYEGETLKAKIAKGPLKIDEAVDIAVQIASGLEKAHEKKIVHRDIKPANIFITKDGLVKILDFGLAKLSGQTQLTKAGSTLGTVAYMSPEQAKGKEVDHRTDIWSLGIIIYEILTGQLPFKGDYEQAVVYSIINAEPESLKDKSEVGPEFDQIANRILQKDPQSRYASVNKLLHDLVEYRKKKFGPVPEIPIFKSFLRFVLKPRVAIPAVVSIILLIIIAIWFFDRRAEIRWAKERSLMEIQQFLDEENYPEAFKLVQKAEKYMSEDPDFTELAKDATTKVTILTDPPGADIYIRMYSDTVTEWENLGKTPIDSIKVPNYTIYRMKFDKTGYENILAVASTEFDTVSRKLFKEGSIPPGMVYVEGYSYEWPSYYLKEKHGFFMDRHEVTNNQYKEFIDLGGYSNPDYWKYKFIKDGRTLTWEEAMAEFTDRTSRPGPATWEASDYPDGQDTYPVSGVSWYEAAAYAEYAGKSLPTGWSWGGEIGAVIPAVEERLKVSLLVVGGFTGIAYPEADPINYLPRIKIPVLMLNGKYDMWRPYETNLKPFYELLGTPEKDKHLILYETDHYIPKSDMIKENLGWLDKYFGPPKK